MKLDFADERVLAVVAHPDDAELLCAGTLARARSEGADIAVCVLCQGDKGQPAQRVDNLAAVRRQEMSAAAELLSARLFLGEVPDSTLDDELATRHRLIEVLREFQPTLLLGHAPGDYHTDHRAASALVETCSWLCASNGQPVSGTPLRCPPQVWWMDTVGMQQFRPTIYVDISAFVDIKEQMLACHRSQINRSDDADFAPLLALMRSQLQMRGQQSGVSAAEAFRAHFSFKRTRAW